MFFKGLLHTKEVYNDAWRVSGDFEEYTDEQLREKQLAILGVYKDVIAVCKKHGLPAALMAGTTLGAVRHKGFIPWDDDMDIVMKREDFEKFKLLFEKELGEKYILNSPNYTSPAIERFAKVLRKGDEFDGKASPEIYLDIFTIENAPQSKFCQEMKGLFCNGFMFIASAVWQYGGGMGKLPESILNLQTYKTKNFIGKLFSFIPASKWFNFVDKIIRQKKSSCFSTMPTSRKHYTGEIIASDILYPFKEVEFEDTTGYIFADTTSYLIHMYGPTYMTPPPENKREKHYRLKK